MSAELQEASEILRKHEQEMADRLDDKMPVSGTGAGVIGSYPVYMVTAPGTRREEEASSSVAFQLQYIRDGSNFYFTKGRVQAGSTIVIPTIGGIAVNTEPPPTLAVQSGGASVFAEYRWTLDPLKTAPDWADVFVSCELIQVSSGAPADTLLSTGLVGGVQSGQGISYAFLMAYDAQGEILTYGMSSIFQPDPDDFFPTDRVAKVFPLVRYVT